MSRLSKPKTAILLVGGLVLLTVLYGLWFGRSDANQADSPSRAERPVSVKTERSRVQDLTVSRDIPATITALEQVVVRPQISGQIERLVLSGWAKPACRATDGHAGQS